MKINGKSETCYYSNNLPKKRASRNFSQHLNLQPLAHQITSNEKHLKKLLSENKNFRHSPFQIARVQTYNELILCLMLISQINKMPNKPSLKNRAKI